MNKIDKNKWVTSCPKCGNKNYQKILGEYADCGVCPECGHAWWARDYDGGENRMTEEKRFNDELIIYHPILELLCQRISEKHREYGTSYLSRDYVWLRKRLLGEVDQLSAELFSPRLSGKNTIDEALDVAVYALLIADKKRRQSLVVTGRDGPEEPW